MKNGSIMLCGLILCCASSTVFAQTAEDWYDKGKNATDFNQQIEYFTKAIQKEFAPLYIAYYMRGTAKYHVQNYQIAILDFDKAIELNPNFAAPYVNRGVSKKMLGRYQEAIQDFDQAIELQSDFSEAYLNRGISKKVLGRYQEAIQDFDQAIKLNPNHFLFYYYRGSTKFQLDQYVTAITDLDKAIELNPADAESYLVRGSTKKYLKQYELAILDLNKAIELDPHNIAAYDSRGYSRSSLKEYQAAILDFSKAIELEPNAIRYNNRGWAKFNLGQYSLAILDYDKAINLNPNYEVCRSNRLLALSKLNADSEKPKVWAVIVGISDYAEDLNYQGLNDLTFCHKDAEQVFSFLRSAEGGATPSNQIALLTNSSATKENILQKCNRIFQQAAENDLIIFYFSGHGGENLFCAYDGSIKHGELKNIIYASKAKKKLCVADACHAGSWDKNSTYASKALNPNQTANLYYEALGNSGDGIALFMASQTNEISIDDYELKQGLFTYYYLDGLKGNADANYDRIITIQELYDYVKKKVSIRGLGKWNKSQNPALNGTFDHSMPVGIRSN
jgi:tetratricopeptide (TPR) repeat protein